MFSLFCQLLQVSSTSYTTSGKSGAAHAVLVTPASVCLPHGWPGRRNPTTPHKPQSCPPPPATREGGYPESGELQQLPLLYRLCHVSVREERQRATAPGSLDKGVYIQLPPHSPPPQPPSTIPQATELTHQCWCTRMCWAAVAWAFLPLTWRGEVEDDAAAAEFSHP